MQTVDLKKGTIARHVTRAVKAINDGYVIAVPLENAYAYLCDAFNHEAVRAMHVLRGDEIGIKAQVLVGNFKMAEGVSRNLDKRTIASMKKYWPGKVTFQVLPSALLNWDLGDNNEVDELALRVPSAPFVKAILAKTGPLATASVAKVGEAPITASTDVPTDGIEIFFSNGKLRKGLPTTVVRTVAGAHTVLREGAVDFVS
ncbi:MAG: Sua5/YciO/YrdC/YwlC family protein [Actinomycetales bacterium]|nr:Sua5/YciO/YrdC/YwlC family protein [Actinomycetales bacterium]